MIPHSGFSFLSFGKEGPKKAFFVSQALGSLTRLRSASQRQQKKGFRRVRGMLLGYYLGLKSFGNSKGTRLKHSAGHIGHTESGVGLNLGDCRQAATG